MAARSDSHPSPPGPDLPVFLVERYLGPAAALELPASVARLARVCSASAGTRSGPVEQVRYLHSTYLPSEDTCFCLFRAATAGAVRALNEAAGFPLDRITAAILLLPDDPRGAGPGTARST